MVFLNLSFFPNSLVYWLIKRSHLKTKILSVKNVCQSNQFINKEKIRTHRLTYRVLVDPLFCDASEKMKNGFRVFPFTR